MLLHHPTGEFSLKQQVGMPYRLGKGMGLTLDQLGKMNWKRRS